MKWLKRFIRRFMIRHGVHCPRCEDYVRQLQDAGMIIGNQYEKLRLRDCVLRSNEQMIHSLELTYAGLIKENNELRAMLMQLRVAPGAQRRGFAVAAFIPSDVLHEIKTSGEARRDMFVWRVAKVLVDKAVKGLLHMEPSGEVTSIASMPVKTDRTGNKRTATLFGDGNKVTYPSIPGGPLEAIAAKLRAEDDRLAMFAGPTPELGKIIDEANEKFSASLVRDSLAREERIRKQLEGTEEQQVPEWLKPKPNQ